MHIGLLEFDRGLVIHDPYALVYINNDDCKFMINFEAYVYLRAVTVPATLTIPSLLSHPSILPHHYTQTTTPYSCLRQLCLTNTRSRRGFQGRHCVCGAN